MADAVGQEDRPSTGTFGGAAGKAGGYPGYLTLNSFERARHLWDV